MAMKKTLDELTLMDDYMFAQVMRNTKYLKILLEFILDIKIAKITLMEPQKSEKEGYNSKGVRLDLYVEDENGVIYNVEVQTYTEDYLSKRMRFYQSVLDISILNPGHDYGELRKTFVIFICNYDPFKRDRVIYTFENVCREEPDLTLGDDTFKIVVNTKGTRGEISDELREILKYLDTEEVTGKISEELDNAVKEIKSSEERRLEYMMLYTRDSEMMARGRREGMQIGKQEGIQEGKILQAISMYRELVNYDDPQITEAIMNKFNLSRAEAEKFVSGDVPSPADNK